MNIIIDTGPLVAFLDQSDYHNYRVGKALSELNPPFYTCEAVVTETIFLLQRGNINPDFLFEMIEQGDIVVKPLLNNTPAIQQIREMIQNYKKLPASLADAGLIYLYEKLGNAAVFTLDSDFTIYRTTKGTIIHSLLPL